VKTNEAVNRANESRSSDKYLLARTSYPPASTPRKGHVGEHQEISSLATFATIRYLLQLGRESGQGRHWSRAVAMIDALLGRMGPLGLSLRAGGRGGEPVSIAASPGGTAWGVHAMLIETMLDLAGLDYDAVDRRITLSPTLPVSWANTGSSSRFPCGNVSYRLDRPIGGAVHQLTVNAQLHEPVALDVSMTCPGLVELGPWKSNPPSPPPAFDPATGRLNWTVALPRGDGRWSFTWG
jgi:hypothetical protein